MVVNFLGNRIRQGHQARLVKLGGLYAQNIRLWVEMPKAESEQFAASQAATEEQDQRQSDGLCSNRVLMRCGQCGRCRQHPGHLRIRHEARKPMRDRSGKRVQVGNVCARMLASVEEQEVPHDAHAIPADSRRENRHRLHPLLKHVRLHIGSLAVPTAKKVVPSTENGFFTCVRSTQRMARIQITAQGDGQAAVEFLLAQAFRGSRSNRRQFLLPTSGCQSAGFPAAGHGQPDLAQVINRKSQVNGCAFRVAMPERRTDGRQAHPSPKQMDCQ